MEGLFLTAPGSQKGAVVIIVEHGNGIADDATSRRVSPPTPPGGRR